MIRVNDNLYPKENIKNVSITSDNGSFILTYYFKEDTRLRPVSESFTSSKDMEKKITELQGKKGKTLLG
jgi:hypothetical protein|nr:MAG TPA: hypothetical protein [Caudoviricetes sp.]